MVNNMYDKIGFIQGRLSPIVDGKIQAFPWEYWKEEFLAAADISINKIEWTLDQERLSENPFISKVGHKEIKQLTSKYGVDVVSLTGDCFMQFPFYKYHGKQYENLVDDLDCIIESCAELSVKYIVIPLVDNGSVDNEEQEETLRKVLTDRIQTLKDGGNIIVFESDLEPTSLKSFINKYDNDVFGINYDIGNSASLGYDPVEEFSEYGDRVYNVHVKDRVLGGTTVPLGTGNADFIAVFEQLKKINYSGNYILQTARAEDEKHSEVLAQYRDMIEEWTR